MSIPDVKLADHPHIGELIFFLFYFDQQYYCFIVCMQTQCVLWIWWRVFHTGQEYSQSLSENFQRMNFYCLKDALI